MTSIWERSNLAAGAAVVAAVVCLTLTGAVTSPRSVVSLIYITFDANPFQVAVIVGLGIASATMQHFATHSSIGRWAAILLSVSLAYGGLNISYVAQALEPEPFQLWWWEAMLQSMALAEAALFLTLALLGITASAAFSKKREIHKP